MKMIKRISLFLALFILLGLLTPAALAAGTAGAGQLRAGPSLLPMQEPAQVTLEAEESFPLLRGTNYVNQSQAVSLIRENLKARNASFTVNIRLSAAPTQAMLRDLMNQSLAHTGNGTEGDYLRWQMQGWNATAHYLITDEAYYDTSITYTVRYFTTAAQEAEMTAAVGRLLDSLDLWDASDHQKVLVIYQYITQNITYDYANLDNAEYILKHSAYAALINKTAVCQGYATLFYRLALELGLDARVIAGTGNGQGHAWNIVKVNGLYYNIDSTWDAAPNTGTRYFLKCDANFPSHTPDPQYLPDNYEAAYPKSPTDYPCGYTHSYTVSVTAPTCTTEGFTTHTCSRCGDTFRDTYTAALGHSYGPWSVDQIPSSLQPGREVRYCACGAAETQPVPALTNPFRDVKEGSYCYEPVLWASWLGVTSGTSAHTFSPDAACTRAQVVTFLWRSAGCPEPKAASSPFRDVSAQEYYYKAVLWAVEQGITTGTSSTAFSPNAACTREQVVTFLWRSAGSPLPENSGIPFRDVSTQAYSRSAIAWAVEQGITNGTSANTFSPAGRCTRGQIVTFLYRFRA